MSGCERKNGRAAPCGEGEKKQALGGFYATQASYFSLEMDLGRSVRPAVKKKVLLFGGSFDPPHLGHMNLLACAIDAVRPHRVLVVPSGSSPHKTASETPGPLREAMCACFEPLFPGLIVSDIELARTGKSYTYDTVAQLRARWPDDSFFLCMGGDMLRSFTTWHRSAELLPLVTLVAHARSEAERLELLKTARALEAAGGSVVFATGPVVDLSSTRLRAAVAAGQDVWDCIPPPADEIIRRNHLYGV